MTAENIMVEPINREKLTKFLNDNVGKNENQEFIIDKDSIFIHNDKSLLIDNECCAGELEKTFDRLSKKFEWKVSLGIRKYTETEAGRSTPMCYEGYIDFSESELRREGLLHEKQTLKDFMGGRFGYNPRIENNTRQIEEIITEILQSKP